MCVCYKGETYNSEMLQLLRERNKMQNMLDKYKRHLSETKANVEVLTAERDRTNKHYQQVKPTEETQIY